MAEERIKLIGNKRNNKKILKILLRDRKLIFMRIFKAKPLERKGDYLICVDVNISDKTIRGAEYEENKLMYERYFQTGCAQKRSSGTNKGIE